MSVRLFSLLMMAVGLLPLVPSLWRAGAARARAWRPGKTAREWQASSSQVPPCFTAMFGAGLGWASPAEFRLWLAGLGGIGLLTLVLLGGVFRSAERTPSGVSARRMSLLDAGLAVGFAIVGLVVFR